MRLRTTAALGLLAVAVVSSGASGRADAAGSDCRSEHLAYHDGGTLATFNPTIDTGIVIPAPASGELVSVVVDWAAGNAYPERDAANTRTAADQLHESFTVTVGGVALGPLTADLPDSVEEGAVDEWSSGVMAGRFSASDLPGGAVVIVHSSVFGFTESPNSLQVASLSIDVERCNTAQPADTCPCSPTTTAVPPTTAPGETTSTAVPTPPTSTLPGGSTTTTPSVPTTAPTQTTSTLPSVTTSTTPGATTSTVPHLADTGRTSGWFVGGGGASLLAGLGLLRIRSVLGRR